MRGKASRVVCQAAPVFSLVLDNRRSDLIGKLLAIPLDDNCQRFLNGLLNRRP
jgi:hypothetical protein